MVDFYIQDQAAESMYLIIGCDDNGVHTEAITCCEHLSDAVVAFAKRDIGPLYFIEIAERLVDSGEINRGDLAVLQAAEDTGKVDIGEIDRYKELVAAVESHIVDIASLVFNFGQFSNGDAYNGRDHNNYVDGGSVSQWKIYQFRWGTGGTRVAVYPQKARESVTLKGVTENG